MRVVREIGTVTGITHDTLWAQALITPSLCGVVEIEEQSGGALRHGVRVLSTLIHADSGIEGLKDLELLVDIPKGSFIRTILLLVPVGQTMCIVLRGEGRVYIKRGDKLARLLEHPGGISGEIQEGDMLLLATARFAAALTDQQLRTVFDHESAQSIAEKLTLMLHGAKEEGGAAFVFEVKKLEDTNALHASAPVNATTKPSVQNRLSALPRRTLIFGGATVIIALLFALSVVLGIIRQQGFRKSGEIAIVLSDATRAFEEGNALVELNPLKGRERLKYAYNLLLPLTQSLSPKSNEGKEVAELFAQVSDSLSRAKNSVSQEPELFYDVGLLKNGSTIGSVALYETRAALLDRTTGTVYELDIVSKNGQIVAGGASYRGATHATIHGETIYVLTVGGIHAVRTSDKKTSLHVVKKSEEWKAISAIIAYAGNLYLLDSGVSRIWKYTATDSGFSPIGEYLNPDTFVDLGKATSIAIDGAVWVGTADGNILRFVGGRQETFVPRGVEPPLGNTLVAFTSDETKSLYVLDGDNKRVVVLDKEGIYLGQYTWQADILPTQMVISEAQKKILLLASGKLYSLNLK